MTKDEAKKIARQFIIAVYKGRIPTKEKVSFVFALGDDKTGEFTLRQLKEIRKFANTLIKAIKNDEKENS